MKDRDEDVLRQIRPTHVITASNSFKERVMQTISETHELTTGTVVPIRRRLRLPAMRWVVAAAAAAALIVIAPLIPRTGKSSAGATLLAQSVQTFNGLRSVHISGRIRTLPNDNFEFIGTQYNFEPVTLWREYSVPAKWRVEKPGRVVVNDGASAILFLKNTNTATRAGVHAGFVDWLRPMLDPQTVLESELLAARHGESQANVNEANGSLILTVNRAARGNFANDWARNKSITESDHTCTYRFDAATKRLTGLEVRVAGTVVAEFTDFRYDEPLPSNLFRLDLPSDVAWMDAEPSVQTVTLSGPREAARYFFDAMAAQNWTGIAPLLRTTSIPDGVKQMYGRLQVISVGEPFQSGRYPGYFVPYEVRLANGYLKSHKLAVRNDNSAGQWIVDGGY